MANNENHTTEEQAVKKWKVRDKHGHVKKSGSLAVVGSVNVEVDSTGGDHPTADSTYQNGQLDITLHDIKGERGNGITSIDVEESQVDGGDNIVHIHCTDDEEVEGTQFRVKNGKRGNGIASVSEVLSPDDGGLNKHIITDTDGHEHEFHTRNGREGKQGKTGIFTQEGNPLAELETTMGDNDTNAMTQKAVTEAMTPVGVEYGFEALKAGNMNNSSIGSAVSYGVVANFYHALFPIKAGQKGRITTKGGTGTSRSYCFTDDEDIVVSVADTTAVLDGVEFTAPTGATKIGVNFVDDNTVGFSLEIYGMKEFLRKMDVETIGSSEGFSFEDENGNVVMKVEDGHVRTKNFDSRTIAKGRKMPYQRRTFFTVNVDTQCFVGEDFTAQNIDSYTAGTCYDDNCVLYLPDSYDPDGKPSKLVIFCKNGATTVEEDADPVLTGSNNQRVCYYLLSLGYAILAADGVPNGWATALGLDERAVGNYVAVQSTIKAYNYVRERYNIDTEGVYIFGYSQGGQYALNIIENSRIPVMAAALLSPAVSMRYHQWDLTQNVEIGGVTFSKAARLNIVRMFNMGVVEDNDDLLAIDYDPTKVAGYDPFTRNVENPYSGFEKNNYDLWKLPSGTSLSDITMKKNVRCPIRIIVADNDASLSADVTKVFVKAVKNAGQTIDIKVLSSGGHSIVASQTSMGSFTEHGTTRNLYPAAKDFADWFNIFGGY